MTVNKKELLIRQLATAYKETFNNKRKLVSLSSKQAYDLFLKKGKKSLAIQWNDLNKHRVSLTMLPYTVLKHIEVVTRDIVKDIPDNQITTLIKIAIEYEKWDKDFKRTYRGLKISRIFNFMSDKGLSIPNDFYRYGVDLETSKLPDLIDTEFLSILADIILR